MITVALPAEDDFDAWRNAVRGLVAAGTPPSEILWQVGNKPSDLFAQTPTAIDTAQFPVPRAFVEMAQSAICHSDPERFGLLYTLLFELRAGRKGVQDAADPLIRRIFEMAKAVRRDIHKMRAFVRFRCVPGSEAGAGDHYIAWFEPDHHIVRANAGFFMRRFASMKWSILTPELSIHWDLETLSEGPPGRKGDAPGEDAVEDQWRAYYASIFNPARLKVKAMLKEMPKKYWLNMPETALVPGLIKTAQAREVAMIEKSRTADAPAKATLTTVCGEARQCRRCPLYGPATQLVFGEGPENAPLMFVGEQPGDQEDLAGHPFVGPGGQVFNRALAMAGVDRDRAYVTNAVKHFKFKPQGKRRIHDKPNAGEIDACRWWLKREIDIVQPQLIVALGATALRSLTGRSLSIGKARGADIRSLEGVPLLATVHPSYLLRVPDTEAVQREEAAFVRDLQAAREMILAA